VYEGGVCLFGCLCVRVWRGGVYLSMAGVAERVRRRKVMTAPTLPYITARCSRVCPWKSVAVVSTASRVLSSRYASALSSAAAVLLLGVAACQRRCARVSIYECTRVRWMGGGVGWGKHSRRAAVCQPRVWMRMWMRRICCICVCANVQASTLVYAHSRHDYGAVSMLVCSTLCVHMCVRARAPVCVCLYLYVYMYMYL